MRNRHNLTDMPIYRVCRIGTTSHKYLFVRFLRELSSSRGPASARSSPLSLGTGGSSSTTRTPTRSRSSRSRGGKTCLPWQGAGTFRGTLVDICKSYKGVTKFAWLAHLWVTGEPPSKDDLGGRSSIAIYLQHVGQLDWEAEVAEMQQELREHMGSWSADESEQYHREQSVVAVHTWQGDHKTGRPRSRITTMQQLVRRDAKSKAESYERALTNAQLELDRFWYGLSDNCTTAAKAVAEFFN